jgi:tripartite-type tricarboxylate transporter receptor subunit TctC
VVFVQFYFIRKNPVRYRFHVSAVALLTSFASGSVFAQEFPTGPVTIIVPQPPGGGTDIISRIVGQQLSIQLGQP